VGSQGFAVRYTTKTGSRGSLSVEDAWEKVEKTKAALRRPNGVTRRELAEILGLAINKKRDMRSVQRWIDAAGDWMPVVEVGLREPVGDRGNYSVVYGLMK